MSELFGVHGLLVAVVALIVIGPKDLPRAMRLLGHWVGRARGIARQFRSGFDDMVREAELAEMEKKWAAENERIMAEHGAGTTPDPVGAAADDAGTVAADTTVPPPAHPVMVERPVVEPAPAQAPAAPRGDGVTS